MPHLRDIVERARLEAAAAGELLDGAGSSFESEMPVEARPLILQWLRDGGYAAAVAQVVAQDPSLASD
jgi:hypothetical protein